MNRRSFMTALGGLGALMGVRRGETGPRVTPPLPPPGETVTSGGRFLARILSYDVPKQRYWAEPVAVASTDDFGYIGVGPSFWCWHSQDGTRRVYPHADSHVLSGAIVWMTPDLFGPHFDRPDIIYRN